MSEPGYNSSGPVYRPDTGLAAYNCGASELICDECCDCEPATLTVVVTGTSTAADGTWTAAAVGYPSLCKWEYKDAGDDISVVAQKSGETMSLVIKNFAEDTTYFSGSQETDHKGACKRLDYTISNGAGSGSADVDGTCTPTCDAQPCAEAFDPPVDAVPCAGCCPSCIPDQISVVLSGYSICTTCCPGIPGLTTIKWENLSISNSFTLDRITTEANCTWGDNAEADKRKNIGTADSHVWVNTDCSGAGSVSPGAPVDIILNYIPASSNFKLSIYVNGLRFAIFTFDNACEGGVANNDYTTCCGSESAAHPFEDGTATITPC